jgi:hypothetical protein
MTANASLVDLPDRALLTETERLAQCERDSTARLIAALAEVDARRLYLGEGCSSLFAYCTRVLRLSEHAAYGRIEAARAARRFPMILALLADGSVTLTTIGLLAPHLTPENHCEVLEAARHKSRRDVEYQVATLRPRPAVPSMVRRLSPPRVPSSGQPTGSSDVVKGEERPVMVPSVRVAPPTVVEPLAPERYKVQFTVSRDTHDKLRRAQDLMRHTVPRGDPATIFDKALTLLLAHLEKKKLAAADQPRATRPTSAGNRQIPASVKRDVWKRDSGRCAFVGTYGRCEERGFLEFHHLEPYAVGGKATRDNLELRCRAHNLYEADLFFGIRPPSLVRESRSVLRTWATRFEPSDGCSDDTHS